MDQNANCDGIFPCRYCQGSVRWLASGERGILVNARKVRVLVPVMKSAGNLVGTDMALMDEITYREVDAFKKHFCQKPLAAPPPSQGT